MTTMLALESVTGAIGVAIAVDGEVRAELTVRTARRHVELMHPAIAEVCRLASTALEDVDAVAVDVGPGLFTGIRVGVAAAKAIAFGRGIPAVGLTSLEVLRAAAVDAGVAGTVVPVVDLRRGDVAWALGDGPRWGAPDKLVAELAAFAGARPGGPCGLAGTPSAVTFVGDGALRHGDLLVSGVAGAEVAGRSLVSPPVASVAVLACAALAEGRGVDAAHLAPCYLREADARINWTTRHDGPREGG